MKGEKAITVWASQHLNVEIGVGIKSDAWAGASYWLASAKKVSNVDPTLTLDELLTRCECAVVGIDGGGLDDLLGLVVVGRERQPEKETRARRWIAWGRAWAHPSVLERRKDIVAKLEDFQRDGDLAIVERVGDDVMEVADIVERVWLSGLMPEKNAI